MLTRTFVRKGTLCSALAAAFALAVLPLTVSAVWLPPAVGHAPVDGVESFDHGPRTAGLVALTFDADMTPAMLQQLRSGAVASWYNRAVRDILDADRVPATIFLTGLWAQTYPADARALADDPLFEIGDHTFDHAAFRTPCYGLAAAQNRTAEITRAQSEIAAVTGRTPTLLRFPGDCWTRSDADLSQRLGLRVISGDVPAGDGFNPSAIAIVSNVLGALRPGSIVMMHIHGGPDAPMTAPALRTIIQVVRQRGLGFATVSQLLGLGPGPATLPTAAAGASVQASSASAATRSPVAPRRRPPASHSPSPVLPDQIVAEGLAPLLLVALAAALRGRAQPCLRWCAACGARVAFGEKRTVSWASRAAGRWVRAHRGPHPGQGLTSAVWFVRLARRSFGIIPARCPAGRWRLGSPDSAGSALSKSNVGRASVESGRGPCKET